MLNAGLCGGLMRGPTLCSVRIIDEVFYLPIIP